MHPIIKNIGKRLTTKIDNGLTAINLPSKMQGNIDATIAATYRVVLGRAPDAAGQQNYRHRLESGSMTTRGMYEELAYSDEFYDHFSFQNHLIGLHESRRQFFRQLPKAAHILDLGGSHQSDERGALVCLGYPYNFTNLTIIDLPQTDSHKLYGNNKDLNEISCDQGLIRYQFHDMVDLSRYADASMDMIVSGQTIEHITPAEADQLLAEVYRVLKPGGYFCLDTPNGRACRLQIPDDFINDDHKVEYTHEELSGKIETAGLKIRTAVGLNYVGKSLAAGVFDAEELASKFGVFDEIRDCYILAYIAQR